MKANQNKIAALTAERLREWIHYDPETGAFTWKKNRNNRSRAGCRAGTISARGYYVILFEGMIHYGQRLAWLYVYGEWPKNQMDHIDGDCLNNRMNNLREATHSQNSHNRKKNRNNTTGFIGVTKKKSTGKYVAQAVVNNHVRHIGTYRTAEEASEAYKVFIAYRGEFRPSEDRI